MDLRLIVGGLAMGLAIAAPLGPVNIIVIREAMTRGLAAALIAGSGAVLADTAFAAIAAFGLTSIAQFFDAHALALNIAGGLLLVALGIGTARSPVSLGAISAGQGTGTSLAKALAAFATTLTNPGALIGVFAVFGAMGNVLRLQDGAERPILVLVAFALGGLAWWLALGAFISRLKSRFSEALLARINRWTGVLIAAFGFALLMNAWG